MFTGIVEEVGAIVSRATRGPGARLTIACGFRDLALGESIAVSGVCLTVDALAKNGFEADASAETLARSTLEQARVGTKVNLERALLPDGRLGGHFVAGHVDGRSKLLGREKLGDAFDLSFALPSELARFVAPKGSIAIDGVSLTVNDVEAKRFSVVIVPHTLKKTTLAELSAGAQVNLEVDVLARYVARHLELSETSKNAGDREKQADDEAPILKALRGAGYL